MNRSIKNILYVFIGGIIGQLFGFISSFVLARILSPANYGVWMTLILIGTLSPILCFGTVETLLKEYPYYIGRGELDNAKKLESGVFGSVVLSFFLALIAAVVYPLIAKLFAFGEWGWQTQISIMILASGIGFLFAFFYHRFAAHHEFRFVGFLDSFRSFLNLVIIVSFSWFWSVKGAVAGYLLLECIVCIVSIYISISYCGKPNLYFNRTYLLGLIKVGFPITIFWWAYMVQTSLGRMMSMSLLGKEPTGYYSLGMSIASMFVLLPQVVGRVLYPKISEAVGNDSGKKVIELLVMAPTKAISLIFPGASLFLVVNIHMIYKHVFPKYVPGLLATQILILGIFSICTIRGGINYLVSISKQKILLGYVAVSLGANIVLNFLLVAAGIGVAGIAWGTVLSGALLSVLVWRAVFRCIGVEGSTVYRETAKIYLPMFVMLAVVIPVLLTTPSWIFDSWIGSLCMSILLLGLYATLLYQIKTMKSWFVELAEYYMISRS